MFFSVEFLHLSPGVSLLALKDCSEEVRREPGYIGVFAAKTQNIKRLLLIKENQTSQVNEFSTFLYMGRCKSLGSLKSFLWYAPSLSGASIWFCFPSWIPSVRAAAVVDGQRAPTSCVYWHGRWHSLCTSKTIPFLSLLCLPFLYKYLEGHKAECLRFHIHTG